MPPLNSDVPWEFHGLSAFAPRGRFTHRASHLPIGVERPAILGATEEQIGQRKEYFLCPGSGKLYPKAKQGRIECSYSIRYEKVPLRKRVRLQESKDGQLPVALF